MEAEGSEGKRRGFEVKRESSRWACGGLLALLRSGFVATLTAVIYQKANAMKSLHILTIVSALLMVFGMPVPIMWAGDKPAATLVPFRLLFSAYAGAPKKDAVDKMEFQINTIDLKQPSEFLKLGEIVRNTKWKLSKFEFKMAPDNPNVGEIEDISELTLLNTETKEELVLILNRVTNHSEPKK